MLTIQGFMINKEANLAKFRKELYVSPEVDSIIPVQKYKVYRENQKHFVMPRFYGLKHFEHYEDKISVGISINNLRFNGSLREATNQPEAVEKVLTHLRNHNGGILSLPTGYGKTTVALYILYSLKVRTIIFVHKEFLMNQWIEKINVFLPNATVGKIQANVVDVVGKDIVIAMIQSVSSKEYSNDVFNGFGFMIIDETHHICTRTFSKIFFRINTKYVLGLSATLERKDGLTKVIHWFIGDLCYSITRQNKTHVHVQKIKYTNEMFDDDFPLNKAKKPSIVEAITKLVELESRNCFLIDTILRCLDMDRKILLLSDRRNHCIELEKILKSKTNKTVGLYLGGMKNAVLKESEKCDTIIGTYSLAHEGLDIPELDTLIMATPKVDIIQSVGRILRETFGKKNDPLVIDIVDQWGCFMSQFVKRKVYYKDTGFFIMNDREVKKTSNTYLFED